MRERATHINLRGTIHCTEGKDQRLKKLFARPGREQTFLSCHTYTHTYAWASVNNFKVPGNVHRTRKIVNVDNSIVRRVTNVTRFTIFLFLSHVVKNIDVSTFSIFHF